jgi:flagellar biosynthetic protein FliQ
LENDLVAGPLRQTLLLVAELGGPPLLAALAVGVIMSLIQAVIQVNEPTLAYLPKLLAIGAVLALTASFALVSMTQYARDIFDAVVMVGNG